MNLAQLNLLRPKDSSPSATRAALLNLRTLRAKTEALIPGLIQERSRVLLMGEEPVLRADRMVASARLDIEQIDALIAKIEPNVIEPEKPVGADQAAPLAESADACGTCGCRIFWRYSALGAPTGALVCATCTPHGRGFATAAPVSVSPAAQRQANNPT